MNRWHCHCGEYAEWLPNPECNECTRYVEAKMTPTNEKSREGLEREDDDLHRASMIALSLPWATERGSGMGYVNTKQLTDNILQALAAAREDERRRIVAYLNSIGATVEAGKIMREMHQGKRIGLDAQEHNVTPSNEKSRDFGYVCPTCELHVVDLDDFTQAHRRSESR